MTAQQTVLHDVHAALGASFTDFGGWDMPLKYGSELAEHKAVREAAGVFDLSHMGEVRVTGPDAGKFLNSVLAGNLAVIKVGKAKYSLMTNDEGGIVDDLITYRLGEEEYLVVPNAGNAKTVAGILGESVEGFNVIVKDESADTSLVAVQGPNAEAILVPLAGEGQAETVSGMGYYAVAPVTIAGIDILLARTGYTGEDGFELYVANDKAAELWNAVLEAGEEQGLIPCGLAARDSLRLEAGMPLYGNELSATGSPFEAGLGPVISFKKAENFPGREALEAAKEAGVGTTSGRTLVGLKGQGRRAARGGYAISLDGQEVGAVTSGQPSPTLGYPVAMAYVDVAAAELGTVLDVDLRGKAEKFEVIELPFYSRKD
ncbi:aminomethyltransferase [Neomicrococcus aestuarii]|uniref:Aminomethyltransferase n=1 Tax=Neomicrococcus aestuarii TaxID=556325 RepID=A0A7W8X1W0_9MICC|nr:glycine cleavage system aminomethyltransferase GcvT [Neomicrococcus aestuarii]MBB5513229.1 aminomethyltransferase [Neomicrococcus aestuarii]